MEYKNRQALVPKDLRKWVVKGYEFENYRQMRWVEVFELWQKHIKRWRMGLEVARLEQEYLELEQAEEGLSIDDKLRWLDWDDQQKKIVAQEHTTSEAYINWNK